MLKKIKRLKKIAKIAVCMLLGALLCQSRVMSYAAPFAALLPAVLPPYLGGAALLGTLLGWLFSFSVELLPVAAATGAALIYKLKGGHSSQSLAASSAVVSGIYLMSASALKAFSGGNFAVFFSIAVISAGFFAVLYIFSAISRDIGAVRGISDSRLLFAVGVISSAFSPIAVGHISLGTVFSGYACIFAAVSYGPTAAAAVALSAALGAGLSSPDIFCDCAVIGIPALICGRFLMGRPLAAASCIAALYLPASVIFGTHDTLASFFCICISAVLFVPGCRFCSLVLNTLRVGDPLYRRPARRLGAYLAAVEKLGDTLTSLAAQPCPENRPVGDIVKTKVCISCPKSPECFTGESGQLAVRTALCERADELKQADNEALRRRDYAVAKTSERLGAVRLGAGLMSAFESALSDVEKTVGYIKSEDALMSQRLKALLFRCGVRVQSCAVMRSGRAELTLPAALSFSECRISESVSEITGFDYSAPERLDCGDSVILRMIPVSEFKFSVGTYRLAARDGVSGDVADSFESEGFGYAILSDGMGVGEKAHAAAALLCDNLRELLCVGFSVETAAAFCSSLLRCALPEESFATFDILRVNLRTGSVGLYKAGGCQSALLLDGDESVLGGGGYPIGILDDCEIRTHAFTVRRSASLVMMSDGMSKIFGRPIFKELKAAEPSGLDSAAERLVREAVGEISEKNDDATAVIVKIERK